MRGPECRADRPLCLRVTVGAPVPCPASWPGRCFSGLQSRQTSSSRQAGGIANYNIPLAPQNFQPMIFTWRCAREALNAPFHKSYLGLVIILILYLKILGNVCFKNSIVLS